ncbi:MAG: PEP-CTERM sorting domain-containing protein [Fimbriimonadales bacterium]
MHRRTFSGWVGSTFFVVLTSISIASAQRLYWLGNLGEGTFAYGTGVSADGRVVVGYSATDDTLDSRAFYWTRATGMTQLEFSAGDRMSRAQGVSADGTVVVGYRVNAQGRLIPVRWVDGALENLPLPTQGVWGYANKVSGDGQTIVGRYSLGAGRLRGFFHSSSTGSVGLAGLSPTDRSEALSVSYDGSVIVGYSESVSDEARAVIWNRSGDIQDISGGRLSRAYAVTTDGTVVVGTHDTNTQTLAFRWTASGGFESLGAFETASLTYALAVADGGSVIVGEALLDTGDRVAVRWIENIGWQDLNLIYESLLAPETVLLSATDISPDGRYIVGFGYNSLTDRAEAWLLDTVPEPTSLMVLAFGLVASLKRRRR